ncbi:hypothetical protein [Siphonobacter aquaeclarae]|uniref:Uncharacterized protein n=1 Tax=Siphonobacter aquaeclarae TaxID=563176 RepID=A0A1G9TA49_9BACT|nr:hypothetical protein [Siphonobacter aquaeclarae]SDM44531.1 hypothetical protein SAMN04488090_3477 [Siphonobacter aquaeclarae]
MARKLVTDQQVVDESSVLLLMCSHAVIHNEGQTYFSVDEHRLPPGTKLTLGTEQEGSEIAQKVVLNFDQTPGTRRAVVDRHFYL